MPNIESFSLDSSLIEEIIGLHHLTNLKKLLYNCKKSPFESLMPNLTHLIIKGEKDNKHIEKSLHHSTGLKKLEIMLNIELEKLEIPEYMSLTHLILRMTNLKELKLIGQKNLKTLTMSSAKKITFLEITEENKDLQIDLNGSRITSRSQIKGIEFLDESKITGLKD